MRVLIVANGRNDVPSHLPGLIRGADLIIAADGGANHCDEIGVLPDVLLGDLDSVCPRVLAGYERDQVEIIRHPPRKNATDLELALDVAVDRGASRVHILGGLGGRWDMSVSNILLAAGEKYAHLSVALHDADSTLEILHPGIGYPVTGMVGETISFLPLGGDVHGVTLHGFEYPLQDHSIDFGSSLGVSNILCSEEAMVTHSDGVLLLIRQHAENSGG